jgi:hypothetical protein
MRLLLAYSTVTPSCQLYAAKDDWAGDGRESHADAT